MANPSVFALGDRVRDTRPPNPIRTEPLRAVHAGTRSSVQYRSVDFFARGAREIRLPTCDATVFHLHDEYLWERAFGSMGRSPMRLDLDGTGRPVGPEVTDDEPRLSGRAFGTPLECSPNPCRSVVLPVGVLRVDEYAVLGEDRAHVVFVPVLEGPQYRFDVFAFYPRHGTVTRRDRSGSRLDRAFVRSFVAWSSNPEHTPVFENPDARYVVHRVVPLATASPWRNPARRSAGRVRRVETRSFDAFAARSTLTARPLAV